MANEYRIDELARVAGTTVRNVRVYQDRGLLPPPRRQGRVGIYDEAHLARLRLIGQLLDRGYNLAHIAELISAWEQGRDLSHVLGLEAAITGPWSDEIPGYVTREELALALGGDPSPEDIERAVRLGVIELEGARFRVPSPRLLHAGSELAAAGMPVGVILDLAEELREDLSRAAHSLVEAVATHLVGERGTGELPSDEETARLAAVIQRLRPLAQMAVDAQLARAMEDEMRTLLGERLSELLAETNPGEEAS